MSKIEHRVRQAGVYFVTTDTWQRRALFKKPNVAEIVVDQLLQCRERGFYRLHAFVLMPDHLHILLAPGMDTSLEKVMQMIKGGSSFRIKKELLYQFPVWHEGFHDRWMRDQGEYQARLHYILQNPVAAKLVSEPGECPGAKARGIAGGVVSRLKPRPTNLMRHRHADASRRTTPGEIFTSH